jgi:hypothetical protein
MSALFRGLAQVFACIIDDIALFSMQRRSIGLLAGHVITAEAGYARNLDIGRLIRRKVVV